jgi:hypothetical protein
LDYIFGTLLQLYSPPSPIENENFQISLIQLGEKFPAIFSNIIASPTALLEHLYEKLFSPNSTKNRSRTPSHSSKVTPSISGSHSNSDQSHHYLSSPEVVVVLQTSAVSLHSFPEMVPRKIIIFY